MAFGAVVSRILRRRGDARGSILSKVSPVSFAEDSSSISELSHTSAGCSFSMSVSSLLLELELEPKASPKCKMLWTFGSRRRGDEERRAGEEKGEGKGISSAEYVICRAGEVEGDG